MGATSREKVARKALKLLGEARFAAFIRTSWQDSPCRSLKLMTEKLDAGTDLKSIFFTRDVYGFQLSAVRMGPNRFQIEFGCQAGPLAGDGGEWEVQFGEDGTVSDLIHRSFWIS